MTENEVVEIARVIARDMISVARSAPANEPVQFVTGNSYMPPLRSYPEAENVWNENDGEHWELLVETLEGELDRAKVLSECPDYDNAIYVVDLARFEYVEDAEGDSLNGDWRPISMNVDEARAALKRGERIRVVIGNEPDDPTLIVHLENGMVISEAVAGWSAGVVEPVCALDSDYLRTFLLDRHSVEVIRDA